MQVLLKAYDMTEGMASMLGSMIFGLNLDGIWHTGIFLYGHEYFYGDGIQRLADDGFEIDYGKKPKETTNLGETSKTREEFEKFLEVLAIKFTPEKYHVLNWNCNHFTNECLKYLLGKPLPKKYLDQAEIIRANPAAAPFVSLIEQLLPQGNVQGDHICPSPTTAAALSTEQTNRNTSGVHNSQSESDKSTNYFSQVETLMNMGFKDKDQLIKVLSEVGGNINLAIDKLLS